MQYYGTGKPVPLSKTNAGILPLPSVQCQNDKFYGAVPSY
jgi:hypothetical protein